MNENVAAPDPIEPKEECTCNDEPTEVNCWCVPCGCAAAQETK